MCTINFMRKGIVVFLLVIAMLFVSCGSETSVSIPAELQLSETTSLYKVFYPEGWKATTGANGSCTISYHDTAITIPFLIIPDDYAKTNDIDSLGDLKDTLMRGNPGGSTEIHRISGKKALWWYYDIKDVELSSFMLPLDGVIITAMVWPSRNDEFSKRELEFARLIVDNFRLTK